MKNPITFLVFILGFAAATLYRDLPDKPDKVENPRKTAAILVNETLSQRVKREDDYLNLHGVSSAQNDTCNSNRPEASHQTYRLYKRSLNGVSGPPGSPGLLAFATAEIYRDVSGKGEIFIKRNGNGYNSGSKSSRQANKLHKRSLNGVNGPPGPPGIQAFATAQMFRYVSEKKETVGEHDKQEFFNVNLHGAFIERNGPGYITGPRESRQANTPHKRSETLNRVNGPPGIEVFTAAEMYRDLSETCKNLGERGTRDACNLVVHGTFIKRNGTDYITGPKGSRQANTTHKISLDRVNGPPGPPGIQAFATAEMFRDLPEKGETIGERAEKLVM